MNHARIIASFEHLSDLHLTASISLASFRELATMPCMRSLQVVDVRSEAPEPLPPRQRILAPRLTLLSVEGDCPVLTQLFTALDAPKLATASFQAIHVDTHIEESIDHYASCIEAFPAVVSPSTMADLSIRLDYSETYGPLLSAHLTDLLATLLALRHVTRFSFSCPKIRLVADHDAFLAVARAWPKLEMFSLWVVYWPWSVDHGDANNARVLSPTPSVLECFRDHCPALEGLTLPYLDFEADVPVPAYRVPDMTPTPTNGAGHGLADLAIGARHIMDEYHDNDDWHRLDEDEDEKATEWARYIFGLFPNLDIKTSRFSCRSADATMRWWEAIKRVDGIRKSWTGSSSNGMV